MNAYQTEASAGCTAGRISRARVRGPIEVLNRIAADPSVRELIRSKARVNQAQVETCLLVAGDPDATANLGAHLTELLAPRLQPQDADLDVKRHVRALALSIKAISEAARGQRGQAIATLELALAHDGRADRQMVWYSLQSSWLLIDCNFAEASAAHQRAEEQFAAAVAAQRRTVAEVRRLIADHQTKLAAAHRTCS